MPRNDGTGPMGKGPRTGWGYGKCPAPTGDATETKAENASAEGIENPGFGMGRGLGRGFRRGGRRGFGRGMGPGMRGNGMRGGNRWS